MKLIFSALIGLSTLMALVSTAQASPTYPWYQQNCSQVQQGDGKIVGAVCSVNDNNDGVQKIAVYYFGYLMDGANYRGNVYANLSLNGGGFFRRPLLATEVGDGNNLPKVQVTYGEFIATTSINSNQFPTGAGYQIYFQAEQVHPTSNPPFSYDNLFGQNYRGQIRAVQF